ncbi:uncharacterized protein LAESUDRAFT_664952 [Laetiporus sulphureus 93-53]|uniref:Mis12-Mtw1 protein family n=1 Tax=Laetiporus sulphureus 93-53 TaxID=1314785 RepID=A0A165BFF9_9APHY|nr:uncharacterized protein LAESUDRAFT_664952 [Laetiporus sulphureus 93-53]KZT00942.1 hypothetical protein LAESUDRAFT_664952 [Laetiporus sulphureus 93-53]
MIPSQSQPTSKRKGHDDGNPLAATAKRLKRETSNRTGPSNKRKLNGEEQPGGLVIKRAVPSYSQILDSAASSSSQSSAPSHAAPRATSSQTNHSSHPIDASRHPSKRFKADSSTATLPQSAKGKERELHTGVRPDHDVEEDVRRMQSETDILRRKSQAAERSAGHLTSEIQFGPPRSSRSHAPQSSQRIRDTTQPLSQQETPTIERNRFMRDGPGSRRKRSLSRGKRISSSYEATGVISYPHTSVPSSSFHKHIDQDLPEPARARQLLIWCTHRAMTESPEQRQALSSILGEQQRPGKDPPPLSAQGAQVLTRVEEKMIRSLAEKRVDTNVYGVVESEDTAKPKRENEQNVKNRAREIKFNAHNQRSKAEEDAWLEVTNHYNAYRTEVLAELEKFASTRVKGKQRASAEDVDEWNVDEKALPAYFRGSRSLDLARGVVSSAIDKEGNLSSRLDDLEFTMDRLHTVANSALETTHLTEADLDRRFAMLNLSSRTQLGPSTAPPVGALSLYFPPSRSRPPPTTDPQDLLRALTRVDAERPQAQVGDAARRAVREVQRAVDAPGVAERRLTGVPPPTPRKPPGTPRRAVTPGRGR